MVTVISVPRGGGKKAESNLNLELLVIRGEKGPLIRGMFYEYQ